MGLITALPHKDKWGLIWYMTLIFLLYFYANTVYVHKILNVCWRFSHYTVKERTKNSHRKPTEFCKQFIEIITKYRIYFFRQKNTSNNSALGN